ncbi:hypothetical protein HQ571_04595 [Candidatus Kuenenbacteria bacterium]|nr:hypothetical protein [Candidatus Kuenenbacteria bacterium]
MKKALQIASGIVLICVAVCLLSYGLFGYENAQSQDFVAGETESVCEQGEYDQEFKFVAEASLVLYVYGMNQLVHQINNIVYNDQAVQPEVVEQPSKEQVAQSRMRSDVEIELIADLDKIIDEIEPSAPIRLTHWERTVIANLEILSNCNREFVFRDRCGFNRHGELRVRLSYEGTYYVEYTAPEEAYSDDCPTGTRTFMAADDIARFLLEEEQEKERKQLVASLMERYQSWGIPGPVADSFHWQYVTVVNPEKIFNGNISFEYSRRCMQDRRGELELIGETDDEYLVRYTIPVSGTGVVCPSGTLHFVPKSAKIVWREQMMSMNEQ